MVVAMDASLPFPVVRFLGLPLAGPTKIEFLQWVLDTAEKRDRTTTIGYLNAAQVNLAFADAGHCRRLAAMDCLYADGMAVVWGAERRGSNVPERVNAGDFTRELIEGLSPRELKLALVGGRPGEDGEPGEAERAAAVFRDWAPDLRIVYHHHGFFDDAEGEGIGLEIEAVDPDLVLVAMGAPRQETWALHWARQVRENGRPRVWWCVGALLEYYAGTRRRAPVWMRQAGLEWAARLVLEPGRLWRRYLIGNPLFVWRVLRGRPVSGAESEQTKS
jgi:N-acetylglucosaminyldiphosphoundecaprenol N-acetyl-beta-D-mannosaminyltransferase